jgi:hypothetical protein
MFFSRERRTQKSEEKVEKHFFNVINCLSAFKIFMDVPKYFNTKSVGWGLLLRLFMNIFTDVIGAVFEVATKKETLA